MSKYTVSRYTVEDTHFLHGAVKHGNTGKLWNAHIWPEGYAPVVMALMHERDAGGRLPITSQLGEKLTVAIAPGLTNDHVWRPGTALLFREEADGRGLRVRILGRDEFFRVYTAVNPVSLHWPPPAVAAEEPDSTETDEPINEEGPAESNEDRLVRRAYAERKFTVPGAISELVALFEERMRLSADTLEKEEWRASAYNLVHACGVLEAMQRFIREAVVVCDKYLEFEEKERRLATLAPTKDREGGNV